MIYYSLLLLLFIAIILIAKRGPCGNVLRVPGTVLTEALHFFSAVSLQVRLDGHEGHGMAGSEISSVGECQEGWRAHQRGTCSPTS